ncbi:MAG: DMT family transporter [Chloroflexi bacterium]|nr:DMT family transporter [Chloroflexota bacterium]
MSPELTGALIALLVPLCFGTGMLLARVGLVHIPAGAGNFVSLIVGWVLIASLTTVLYPDALFGVTLGTFAWLAMIGIINFPAGRFLNFVSIKNLGILRANPVLAMAPIISAFEGVVFLGERLNWAIAGGTLLTVTGVIVAVYGEVKARGGGATRPAAPAPSPDGKRLGLLKRRPRLFGYLAAFGAACSYGTITVLGRIAVTDFTVPLVTATYTMLVGFIVMGLFSSKSIPVMLRDAPRRALLSVALGGLFMSSGVAFLYLALSKAPVVVVSPVFALNPVVALVLAHFFLQRLERITLPLVLGTFFAVGGVVTVIIGTQL